MNALCYADGYWLNAHRTLANIALPMCAFAHLSSNRFPSECIFCNVAGHLAAALINAFAASSIMKLWEMTRRCNDRLRGKTAASTTPPESIIRFWWWRARVSKGRGEYMRATKAIGVHPYHEVGAEKLYRTYTKSEDNVHAFNFSYFSHRAPSFVQASSKTDSSTCLMCIIRGGRLKHTPFSCFQHDHLPKVEGPESPRLRLGTST